MTKNKPTSKKVVIFLVEGFSDRHALQKILQRIYRNRELVFEVTRGDITSDKDTWDYIKIGHRSLERHTNLHYYFIDNPLM